jgi:hypothetical protein
MGEMLREQEMNKGQLKQGSELPQSHDATTAIPTLAEVGIIHSMSSRAQKIAKILF